MGPTPQKVIEVLYGSPRWAAQLKGISQRTIFDVGPLCLSCWPKSELQKALDWAEGKTDEMPQRIRCWLNKVLPS